jgi:hypothetical protein
MSLHLYTAPESIIKVVLMTIYNYCWFEIVQYNLFFHLKTNTNHSFVQVPHVYGSDFHLWVYDIYTPLCRTLFLKKIKRFYFMTDLFSLTEPSLRICRNGHVSYIYIYIYIYMLIIRLNEIYASGL